MQAERALYGTARRQAGADQKYTCGQEKVFCHKQRPPVWKDDYSEGIGAVFEGRLHSAVTGFSGAGNRKICKQHSVFAGACKKNVRGVSLYGGGRQRAAAEASGGF